MANGVYHTGYGIEINLTEPDLGHPDRPDLLDEIMQPPDARGRELLECLHHRDDGVCKSELSDKSPWMSIRRRRAANGKVDLVAAHLPVTHKATPEESDKHKAMKERIAEAARSHGLDVSTEARSSDGRVITDVLIKGPDGRKMGWEPQFYPMSVDTVHRRSRNARANGVTPVWVTNDDRATLIDRAPWARVDDVPWQRIASRATMLIRTGVRHLQIWKCTPTSERQCPDTGNMKSGCGAYHSGWFLPGLCVPRERATEIDELVVTSADGGFVPVSVPSRRDPRRKARMWVSSEDRHRWWEITGCQPDEEDDDDTEPESALSFSEEELDRSCRYGEENPLPSGRRPRRGVEAAAGWHTFTEPPRKAEAGDRRRRIPGHRTS